MSSDDSPRATVPPAGGESDATLIARVAAGDRRAAARLVDQHKVSVFRFARALVRDDSLAEDVLQETFIAALRGAATFRGEGSARGWLFTIARHAAARLRPRERPLGDDDDVEALGAAAGWGADDPEHLVSEGEARGAVTRALDSLDPEDREVLVLRDMEGLTGPEAAEVLHVGLAAMKSRLHRARLRFVAALRAQPGARSGALDLPGFPAKEAPHEDR